MSVWKAFRRLFRRRPKWVTTGGGFAQPKDSRNWSRSYMDSLKGRRYG